MISASANEPEAAMQPQGQPVLDDPQVLQAEFEIPGAGGNPMENPPAPNQDYAALFPVPTTQDGTPAFGVAIVEGIPDGADPPRTWAPGSLVFAPVPFPLKWQPAEDEGHEGSVVVGRVDAIWRDGSMIRYTVTMDSAGVNGREAERLIAGNFLRGVSIMADDVTDEDVEYVYPPPPDMLQIMPAGPGEQQPPMPEPPSTPVAPAPVTPAPAPAADMMPGMDPGDMEPGGPMDMMEPCEPIACIYHYGRIRSLTIVAEPAYVEATISLGPSPFQPVLAPEVTPLAEVETMVAAAVGAHSTPTSDAPWDGPAAEAALPSPMPVGTARKFYAWLDDSKIQAGEITKDGGKFGHHNVDGSTPGAANIKACQSGIGVLNGGRGGTTIPGADVQGVYDHLAKHLRDAGLEPAPLTASAGPTMVAGGYTITIPEVWPEWWFAEPDESDMAGLTAGAVNITPEGRVFGLLAPGGVGHRAFRAEGQYVTAPRGIDYSEWQNKACIVASSDGVPYKINAGTVTFDCGHASPFDSRRADPAWAAQHYDNSCSVAMRARVGENRFGTWIAGGLVHGLTASAFEQIMGCALSGDWQGGKLKAALLVPCEGFPKAVTASVREKFGTLVASSVPLRYIPPPPPPDFGALFALIASATGRGPEARFAELTAERFDEIASEGR